MLAKMRPSLLTVLPLAALLTVAPGCRSAQERLPPASDKTAAAPSPAVSTPAPIASSKDRVAPAMDDRALGALIESLSEPAGDFPSDNFVSNETSYLDVLPALEAKKLQGRAYVGVGPEQNLSYALALGAAITYVVDLRRQNLLEHLVFRALAENAPTRTHFLYQLTAREFPAQENNVASLPLEQIAERLRKQKPVPRLLEQAARQTETLMGKLGLKKAPDDPAAIRKILEAFSNKALDITYSMKGSQRSYPALWTLLNAAAPGGEKRSFLAKEDDYQRLRALYRENRIVPVVGDFSGTHALKAVAEDMRQRKLLLGVFYTSNVEQYLFEDKVYPRFVDNLKAFPTDSQSTLLRVWFDQGRAHPMQKTGHRTTSLVMGLESFLKRQSAKPFRSYWEVVTEQPESTPFPVPYHD